MTYQVLARKLRPGNFQEMIGQGHVLKTLSNALDSQRLHHAYLFTGTRGVGKTTIARILARCLNCEVGVSATPCGECSACREISEGRFIDLIEVDAASRTKVEDTRELLDNVQYAPSRGRYKIYLIDEVHMLSNHSFNALLKTLEEPPPHIKFLLATTDPQKLPVTILSRCLQFHLKALSPQAIAAYLQKILNDEGIQHEEDALWQIAMSAAGSMRDALTLLDQAISFCDGKVSSAGVVAMLGTPGQKIIASLLDGLYQQDSQALLATSALTTEGGQDHGQLIDGLMSALHRIAVAKAVPASLDNSFGDQEMLSLNASRFTAEDLQLYYQMCLKGKAELPYAVDPAAMFEMLLLRMLVFSPEGRPKIPQTTKAVAKETVAPVKKKPEPIVSTAPVQSIPELPNIDNDQWLQLFPKLGASGITGSILGHCVCQGWRQGRLQLLLPEQQSAVFNAEHQLRIENLLSRFFGQAVNVAVQFGDSEADSPVVRDTRDKADKRYNMITEFTRDPVVEKLIDQFSARVLTDTVTSTEETKA